MCSRVDIVFFFFNDTATTEIYTLSLHDALPIYIVKYVFGFFILMGGSPDEFLSMFENKSSELDNRWNQMFLNITNKTSVVLFDIDGVIADYSKHYETFLEDVCGLVKKESKRMSYSFFETYGITRQDEEKFNEDFIKMGGFRNISVFDGVVDVMKKIKSMGHKIILITARYERDREITVQWLKDNGIKYHTLIMGKIRCEYYIDDKGIEFKSWKQIEKRLLK